MLLQVNDGVDEVEADGEYRAQLQFGWRRRVQVLRQRLLRVGSVKANEPARINAVVVVSEPSTKAAHNYSVLRVSAKHLSSTAWFRSASIITVVSKHSRRSTRSRRSDRAKLEMRAYLVVMTVNHLRSSRSPRKNMIRSACLRTYGLRSFWGGFLHVCPESFRLKTWNDWDGRDQDMEENNLKCLWAELPPYYRNYKFRTGYKQVTNWLQTGSKQVTNKLQTGYEQVTNVCVVCCVLPYN